jgi:FtsH-binding integral membrane protein
MSRTALWAFVFDALCVLLMVVIGTRNHETDTGATGILFVSAPFWIALSLAHLAPLLQRKNRKDTNTFVVWGNTVAMGMLLRNMVFNRGTAVAFIIVATVFLGITMFGWRALLARGATT